MSIGYIDEPRLKNIPKRHQVEHELSFFLHDQIAALSRSYEKSGAGKVKIQLLSEAEKQALRTAKDPIDFLISTNRGDDERRLVINHICAALIPDMLHFIFEGLTALEKRKFTVALSLFRKPLREAMPILAMMCADEKDFMDSFRTGGSVYFNGRTFDAPFKKALIEDAINKLSEPKFGDAETIYDICLNMKNEMGLARLFDKATHLFTINKEIRTEDYNINFVFKDPRENDIYETVYFQLSYLLVFIHLLQIELFSRTGFDKDSYLSLFMMSAIGAFEAVHGKGRSKILTVVNKTFSDLMVCGVCESHFKIQKKDAAQLFLLQRVTCQTCTHESQFPLTWMMSHAKVKRNGK
jgi:hypothetical protein